MSDREPSPGADPFEYDDAAYVLGALDSESRAAFESHLAACPACPARVAALQRVAGALAFGGDEAREALALSPAVIANPAVTAAGSPHAGPAQGSDRVAELARRVERRRRRAWWLTGGFGAAAAAAVAALVVVLAVPAASPAVDGRQMTATGEAAISATAAIIAKPWGSEITIDCRYAGGSRYVSGDVYTLEVVDRAGRSRPIGSWSLGTSTQARFTSGTALPPGQIGAVTVVTSDGTVVLRLAA